MQWTKNRIAAINYARSQATRTGRRHRVWWNAPTRDWFIDEVHSVTTN